MAGKDCGRHWQEEVRWKRKEKGRAVESALTNVAGLLAGDDDLMEEQKVWKC